MEYLTKGYQPLMAGGEQDYFNFQPDQIGARFLQSNVYLDQFYPNLSLERRDDFLNFITPTDATNPGSNPGSLIDQFNISDIARDNACDTPEVTTARLATWTSNKTVMQHGQMTPGNSLSPTGISTCTSTSAATKSRTRRLKADTQDRNRDEKPRRRRRSKKAKIVSPEDQQARRKKFLERNRKAAAKCRSRKKEWQEKLEVSVEDLTLRNAALVTELAQVRQQYDNLKALLVSHYRVCPAEDLQGWVDAREKSALGRSPKSKPFSQLNEDPVMHA